MPRKFKPGDWVKLKGKNMSPKMEVLKYTTKQIPLLKIPKNDTYLECVWYEKGERKAKVFHQHKLIKHTETGGLYQV